ncbi:hypothetical protein F5I97DRAFT_1939133 [Phlebopus sp. FC_14]|nr:hypothetical protein F5I97DRAFT_1939133 [Phlebopus sp. FC_14]
MDIEMASPVGPMVVASYGENPGYGVPAELDLCELLRTMSLSKGKNKVTHRSTDPYISYTTLTLPWRKAPETDAPQLYVPHASQNANEDDANTEDPTYHSNSSDPHPHPHPTTSDSLPASSILVHPTPVPACHFLQSILASLAPESPVLSPSPYPYPAASAFQTTNGAYLDTILTHRSLLGAFPPAHRGCAATLQEIARALEVRAWQADRESDAEAVAALRQEAYLTSVWV